MKKALLTLLAITVFVIVFVANKYEFNGLGAGVVKTGFDEDNLTEHSLIGKRVVFNEPMVYRPCSDDTCSKYAEWKEKK